VRIKTLTIFILFLLNLTNCNLQDTGDKKVEKFIWTKGPEPNNKFRYSIALSTENEIITIGGDNDGAFEKYNLKTGKWDILPSLPSPRAFSGGTIHNNSIYVIGGIDTSKNYSSKVEKYDLLENEWITCAELNVKRSRLSAVTLNGKIYAIGGMEGTNDKNGSNSSIVEEYDPEKDNWTIKTDKLIPRHGHSALTINDKILIVGGYGTWDPLNSVEEYNPRTNTSVAKAEMPTPRGFFGLVAVDNYVYAIAGRVRQDKGPIERYDFKNDFWTELAPVQEWRNRFGITAVDNKIYIIGGEYNPRSFLVGEIKNE